MSKRREYLSVLAAGLTTAMGGCLQDGSEGSADGTATDAGPTATEATETEAEPDSGTETETPLEGSVRIGGSSTLYPLSRAVLEGFIQQHPQVEFSVSRDGTGGGFANLFCTGESDFNNASRPITAGEQDQCASNDVDYHEMSIATDALTVIVNNDSDWGDCMTTDQLRQIWRADGATTWADVDSDWPDEEIQRFGPADTSGTFDYFRDEIIGENAAHTSEYQATEQDNTILQAVQSDQYAIGYLGFAYYQANSDAVSAPGIDAGDGCVEPSLESAQTGEYPLARPLFTYVNTDRLAEAHVAEFARYFVEQSANEELVADKVGFLPNTETEMQEELDALNDAIANAQ
ncbi:PstS family phosphate ABC transporter substrate-binding protein [Haloarcula salinisoli]|uniref:PstS family phosphate ABC transporter substrate-binding protein n=1 Tax=Haloarcula salinisoli TaxID=2487746 RepID=A0A8J8C8M8_9EURY|nr:PstS family phosphate ABC transporter substrate-binding protein [Halomicroarcula salinisoli]MBX0287642.1 PstS family phosphate ABC transporter substrate-binding protein [Halomicroarcula salinisoli]MBX0304571.1 PstS family phosphate ABC transporter substrate-binding protein [Halomicroarcula salinisoli]